MWPRKNSKFEPCQATPDIYFIMDKSRRMLHGWPHVPKFVLDMVTRLSNQNLRVSIITYSCKGNIFLPITGDREEILKGIERMKYTITTGHEHIYQGLWKATKQMIKANRRGAGRPSMIIFLLNGPLSNQAYGYSLDEANDARKMGATIYGVGTGQSERNQIIGLTGGPDYAFTNKRPEDLNDLINPLASKICPSLKTAVTRIICIKESNPVVLEGYGFDFAMRKEDVICRFYLGGVKHLKDANPINITKTTITCPGPIVDSEGRAINILLSLDNGKNFLNNGLYVASRICGKSPLTTVKTSGKTTTITTKTTRRTTTTTPSTTTTTPTTITEKPKPSIDKFIFVPILLALLLSMLLIGCCWQLCCVPPVEELPPPQPRPQPVKARPAPAPQPKPREKEQPPRVTPPAPTVPVNSTSIVIICCCTCRGLYVSRDVEGNVTVCNFNPLCCPQLSLIWPQYGNQGWFTNVALAKEPCIPKFSLPPSPESLRLASCSQCHRLPDRRPRRPLGLWRLALHSWVPRVPRSLPPT
ncbi:anthrax toxin receptor-like isoform X2 [Rattus norvegicus]|nr:anthrax toxin receptor-like isoform X2 [Rattus norvegicus]XP_017455792.1 anthrax toxin receptor-like isoform X2 [Rattus norvegicus]XP_038950853.1 anthrax toxin receptor-like isoform X2 [Rattus norvegicus]|eukprot:XP_017455791.1 PREDICTED: anthrax toxin receptor-like isoform X2 [Rattus norvegicus]